MAHKRIAPYLIGAAVVAFAFGTYWRSHRAAAVTNRDAPSSAPVRTATVQRRDMPVVQHTLGKVVANATVQVTARVTGRLESAHFKEGQFVRQGQLLFEIDPAEFQIALTQARAVLLRDEAQLKSARRAKQRYERLFAQNSASAEQRDTASTNVDVLVATVAADRAAVSSAQLNLSYTRIRAPIAGKTGALLVHPGNTVSANAATPLVTITQMRPVKLSFGLPQSDLPLIHARTKDRPLIATIDVERGHGNRAPSAPVAFMDSTINDQSGTIQLRANFANTDLSLLPGQLVNVTVKLKDISGALVVPRSAIDEGPKGSFVYQVVGGHAMQRSVKVLFDDGTDIAFEGSVRPGDKVIIEGQLRVVPGGPVRVMPPITAAQDKAYAAQVGPDGAAY